jgi:NAD(P)-dependent dehydrogenase (short-subunit alcohol dehydrogenase family)
VRHTLVVGGTRGIGRCVARRFASDGHAVSILGRRKPPEADRDAVRLWQVDLADSDALTQALQEVTAVGGLLDNVIFLQRFRGEGDDWTGEFDVSLTATREIVDALAPHFAAAASIVIVGSHASHLVAMEQPIGYHAAKAALTQMARYLAVELGPRSIRVNVVLPGSVIKEESAKAMQAEAWSETVAKLTPLRRLGTSEDVAAAVALLCSPDAAFVTGAQLAVDGGLSLLWQESLIRAAASPKGDGR